MKRFLLAAALLLLVGAGCTDWTLSSSDLLDAKYCLDLGDKPYAYSDHVIHCENPTKDAVESAN